MTPRSPRFDQPPTTRRSVATILALAVSLGLGLWLSAALAQPVTPTQRGRSWDQVTVSAATATAVSATITPLASERARIYGLSAFCSAGAASVSITNGGASGTGWLSSPALFGTSSVGVAWTPAPFTGSPGSVVVVTLGACSSSGIGTLTVQADTYGP